MTSVPSRIADCTLRRAIQDNPGAISSLKVGSMSSVKARLTNRHSLSGRRSWVFGLYVLEMLGLRAEGGGESLLGYEPAIKNAELAAGVIDGKEPEVCLG